MRRLLASSLLALVSFFTGNAIAQQNCPAVDSVKKWEVISSSRALAYDQNDRYYFFMSIRYNLYSSMETGKPVSLRFFSSTICRGDTVVVNGTAATVDNIEGIRR